MIGVTREVPHVFSRQLINAHDPPAALVKFSHHMATQETGGTGDENNASPIHLLYA
jgi:hypothetical protein